MNRRDFVRICAASASAVALPDAHATGLSARRYDRARLIDDQGRPIRLAALRIGANYVFDYPYASTPCFLLRLDRPATGGIELRTHAGEPYRWEGGIGPNHSVVAYSAICAHQLAYPAPQVSFIAYRHEPGPTAGAGRVIACCSERSIYDPAAGARVISGPARQPLATILLEHDPGRDETFAVGTFGGELFEAFFRKYDLKLQLDMGRRAHDSVDGTAVVKPLEQYSAQTARC